MLNGNGGRRGREVGGEVEEGRDDLGWMYFTMTQRPMNAKWLMELVEVYVFESRELLLVKPKKEGVDDTG